MTDFKELREALDAGPEPIGTDLLGDRYFSGGYSTAALTEDQDAYIAAANPAVIRSLLDRLEAAEKDAAAKQARIDALMLEYCQDEMTDEQIADWSAAQIAVDTSASMKEQQP